MSYDKIEWDEDDIDDLDDLVSDEKEAEKDKKYKVVLSPSFPGEYRAVFEDVLKELEKKIEKNEKKA